MKVSVLVPVYNGERHLAECLETVLNQSIADIEILISDNCSTDGTLDIIETFAARDHRIRWWQNPQNLGMTGNHNACLRQARGEYIKYVHADDKLLSPLALQKMVAALDQYPGAVMVGVPEHHTSIKSKAIALFNKAGVYDGKHVILTGLEHNCNPVGSPTLTMFRRAAAQKGFDERFTSHLDTEMWCHLLEQGDYVFLSEALATWRVHEHQHTTRFKTSGVKDYDHLRLMEIFYAKNWLRQKATARMLFIQIYYLQKHFGREAAPLTSVMMRQLTRRWYAWQWLKHKALRPMEKLARRFGIVV